MKLYVVLTESAGGGGPKIGAVKLEIPIEVPDKSGDSYNFARKEAIKQFTQQFKISEARVYMYGLF